MGLVFIQVENFQASTQSLQGKLKTVKEQYTQSKLEAQRELAKFSEDKVALYSQVSAAQDEYDCLKVLQAEEAQKYAQSIGEERKVCMCSPCTCTVYMCVC